MVVTCGALALLRGYFAPNIVFRFLYNNYYYYQILPYNDSVRPALSVQQTLIRMRSMVETVRYNLALTEIDPAKASQ
jgi:hypothetical protein